MAEKIPIRLIDIFFVIYFTSILLKKLLHFNDGLVDLVLWGTISIALVSRPQKMMAAFQAIFKIPPFKLFAIFLLYYFALSFTSYNDALVIFIEVFSIFKWLIYFFLGFLLTKVYKINRPEFSTHILVVCVSIILMFSLATYNWSGIGDLNTFFGFYRNSYESLFSLRSVFALFSIIIFIMGLNHNRKMVSLYFMFSGVLFTFMSGNRKIIIAYFIIFTCLKFYEYREILTFKIIRINLFILFLMISPWLFSTAIVKNSITEYSNIEQPRIFAYMKSFEIARDYFPVGSAPATFASRGSRVNYSPIYAKYEMDNKWGFRENDNVVFALDTYWAQIIGQYGVIGTILIVLIFISIFKAKYTKKKIITNKTIIIVFLFLSITTPALQRTETTLMIFFLLGIEYSNIARLRAKTW